MLKMIGKVRREFAFAQNIYGVMRMLKELQPDSPVTIVDEIETSVDRYGSKPAIVFEGTTLSYAAFDARANRVAHWALAQGFKPGDTVSLMLENCPDFPAVWFGLAKIGVVTALINTNLQGDGLAHCITIVESKAVIAGGDQARRVSALFQEHASAVALWDLDGRHGSDLEAALAEQPDTRPAREHRAHLTGADSALFIYTSGTTGLPKAARITHNRLRGMARYARILGKVTDQDRVYNTLPLYHSTGGGMGTAGPLIYGATVILRRKLSVSAFWDDVAAHQATKFVYIGELCRYLLNSVPHAKEREHRLVAGFGNGLRGDVWEPFVRRFGVPQMHEFYGSTEGNVSLVNFDGKIGAIGRLPTWLEGKMGVSFVKFDVEAEQPMRGADGFCLKADVDEPGEAIGRIGESGASRFEGYHDKKATEKKILTDVFEQGDRWFRTGDLMRRDKDGYVYFVDRIGDTFRWKGENVATNDVSDAVSKYPGVALANVYGVVVPGADGRAGMVAMTIDQGFEMDGLADHLKAQLPSYAVPLFLRIQPEAETTGTMKFRKVELVKQGFDIAEVGDPIWFLEPGANGYVRLNEEHIGRINAGEYRL
jgi:fatty-acyl-CoA synthase